ncbi:MAG: HAMP domain-containing histidine kinase [Prevotella sp.]|nr:HAMP domain-containing histidine kinase [Prevotella sp.]
MMVAYFVIAVLAVLVLVLAVVLYRWRMMLQVAQKENYMKLAFLRNISHEIRTPLKVVNELSQTVAKEDLYLSKNEKRNIADQMQYNTSLVSTLLDEVMEFSDNEAEGHHLKDDSFSPNALCRRCLEANMYSVHHQQDVKLSFKRELSDEYFVKSDRHVVELILNKLIVNACRFTEKGSITVGCNTSERIGMLTVFVCDTGVGIPENRMSRLFSWFESPTGMMDDAELDLSICRRLAEKLGGELAIDANYTTGTRIMLLLPLK